MEIAYKINDKNLVNECWDVLSGRLGSWDKQGYSKTDTEKYYRHRDIVHELLVRKDDLSDVAKQKIGSISEALVKKEEGVEGAYAF